MLRRSVAMLALFAFTVPAAAEDPKAGAEELKAARDRLDEFLKGIKGAENARVAPLTADGVAATFPDHVVFTVLFPQYPVARISPPPLKSSNVVAVPKAKDGKPVPVTDVKELEKFFKASAKAVKPGDDSAVEATKAWLRCAAELNQDGFYKFTVKAGAATAPGDNITSEGAAAVDPQGGNKGEVKARLTFKDGKLASAETKADLNPGVRPICQATKLLDPDPIVRAMAEQSIRVMGSAAKPYLDEQRAKAAPELQKAIDRIWARIQKEGR